MERSPVGSRSKFVVTAWLLFAGALGLVVWGSTLAWAATPAPTIPHALKGREDCSICHGPMTSPPLTASHAGRTVSTCMVCHVASSNATSSSPMPDGLIQGTEQCLACHQNYLTVRTDTGGDFS